MSPEIQTTYTVYGRLMHRKAFGDKDLGSFVVVVPNTTGNPNFVIDTEALLSTAAQQTGNQNFNLDRRGKSYDLKFTISASRNNSKFVNSGEGPRTQEIKAKIEKF
jgi:hypothetical protein